MSNMPELKIGVVAVSRDCFPESLSVTRRENLIKAYKEKYGEADIYECPICIAENTMDILLIRSYEWFRSHPSAVILLLMFRDLHLCITYDSSCFSYSFQGFSVGYLTPFG